MNFLLLLIFGRLLAGTGFAQTTPAAVSQPPDVATVSSIHAGLTLKIQCKTSFEDNREVEMDYSVKNESGSVCKMAYANGIHDVDLVLINPDGKRIMGYHEMPGTRIDLNQFKRFLVETVSPGQEIWGDPIPVSLFWPLESSGEYRCVVTKTVYQVSPGEEGKFSYHHPGIPVTITSPEFRFRIESIDRTFRSRVADRVQDKIQTQEGRGEPEADLQMDHNIQVFSRALIGLIVLSFGYLGVSSWKRWHRAA